MKNSSTNIYIILGILIVILILGWLGYLQTVTMKSQPLATYFSYTNEEREVLRSLSSKYEMATHDLRQWEEKAYELVSENKTDGNAAGRFYTYLFMAQRDAAFLSFNTQGKFSGLFDPVSKEVICIFFPENCEEISKKFKTDSYSEALAKLVIAKVKDRMAEDKKGERIPRQSR